ncbi:hypothetical protein FBU30_009952 [Linnemannia zychae]|nr:hypothetical protein FBU30_009952 [Linnemannia zychae]
MQGFANGVVCVNGKSVIDEAVPERFGTVRLDDFWQDVAIQPTEDDRSFAAPSCSLGNKQGNTPSRIINWAAKSGVPRK